ncbi:N-acetylneuraminate synthase family protein [Blastopirellula sp. J2-11]|uniref:N-acetylneuraminate synthase family protein n=1 Tax=Blastopirellula sp. J2-11 TaxID=2943192 RepID=UPI0021CA1512|nr:N-acetylneuraminate synthase family protein [Blastopirellula sp. J2-11]UUO04582.1 N-acetylneuraminate synthase family protein [Blastopirellula sp. J2-11]
MLANFSHQLENIASSFDSDDIFIIGKGPSIDELQDAPLNAGITINLNDSEQILPGQIGILSASWVKESLTEVGFGCQFYLSGRSLPDHVPHMVLPTLPAELDQEELTVHRLRVPVLWDEPLVLLTALKVCQQLAQLRGRPQNVYLLGLDFSTRSGGLSAKVERDFAGASLDEREVNVHAQEHHFRQFQRVFEDRSELRLIHVGHRDISSLTPGAFLNRLYPGRYTAPATDPHHVLVVAELTNNHLGSASRLVELVERSKAAGADYVKVQKRDVDNFYSPEQLKSRYWSPFGSTLGDYRRGVELNDELLDLLEETCRRCQIGWFCSVLDFASFEAIQRFNPSLIKIPSTISEHEEFHAQIAECYDGPVVVSTGATEAEYVEYVLDTFRRNSEIYLLHCVSAYPAPRESCNISIVHEYSELSKQDPRIFSGYSSHDLGSLASMMAVANGARMIEKHVKLGDVDWVHFDKVAVDLRTDEFTNYVRDIRLAREVLGDSQKRVLSCEHHKYPALKTKSHV